MSDSTPLRQGRSFPCRQSVPPSAFTGRAGRVDFARKKSSPSFMIRLRESLPDTRKRCPTFDNRRIAFSLRTRWVRLSRVAPPESPQLARMKSKPPSHDVLHPQSRASGEAVPGGVRDRAGDDGSRPRITSGLRGVVGAIVGARPNENVIRAKPEQRSHSPRSVESCSSSVSYSFRKRSSLTRS